MKTITTFAAARLAALTLAALVLGTGAAPLLLATPAAHAICVGDGCPEIEPTDTGTGGTIPTPGPDIIFQFGECLPSTILNGLADSAKSAAQSAISAVDLKNDGTGLMVDAVARCTAAGTSVLGIWLKPALTTREWADRPEKLEQVQELQGNENFAIRVSARGLGALVGAAWNDRPNVPPAHFRYAQVTYQNSVMGLPALKRVTTTFVGYVDGPFSDTDFWVVLDDTLTLVNSRVQCSTQSRVDMEDDTFDYFLNEIFALEDPNSYLKTLPHFGPGCEIARAMPTQVLLPGSYSNWLGIKWAYKEVFDYARLSSTPSSGSNLGGVATGGQHRKVVREPSVTIQGPSSVQEELAEPLSATFRALTGDLRSPTAVWSAPGATVQASGLNATITWPSFQGPGQSKSVYVTITDADALTAKASKSVLLKAANSHSVEGD